MCEPPQQQLQGLSSTDSRSLIGRAPSSSPSYWLTNVWTIPASTSIHLFNKSLISHWTPLCIIPNLSSEKLRPIFDHIGCRMFGSDHPSPMQLPRLYSSYSLESSMDPHYIKPPSSLVEKLLYNRLYFSQSLPIGDRQKLKHAFNLLNREVVTRR